MIEKLCLYQRLFIAKLKSHIAYFIITFNKTFCLYRNIQNRIAKTDTRST